MSSLSAIGPAASASAYGVSQSAAVLQSQLARYQVQLADWVNCPSCTTPEGKAQIQQLSDKVSDTQRQINATDAQRPNGIPTAQSGQPAASGVGNQTEPSLNVVGTGTVASATSATGTIGALLNVYA